MAKAKKQVIEGSTVVAKVAELRAEISKMAMQLSKMQLKNTTSLRTKKDELARVLTTMNMQKKVQTAEKMKEKEATK